MLTIYIKKGGKFDSLEFQETLVEEIIRHTMKTTSQKKKTFQWRKSSTAHPLNFPDAEPLISAKKGGLWVSTHEIRKSSYYQCTECDVGMCEVSCFKSYNT